MSNTTHSNRRRRPPAPPRLGPAEYALMGLLATTAASASGVHGYDLARSFANGPLADVINLEHGMLYHNLKKLDRAGYVTTTTEAQQGRPDRQVQSLSPEGHMALEAWLPTPVTSTREMRLDFLLKLYFARAVDGALARKLVAGQTEVLDRLIASLETQLAEAAQEDPFRRSVLDLRLGQTQAARAWLAALPEAALS